MRWRITGITGSGKTYLGKKLSKHFAVAHYEMDHLVFFASDDTDYTKINDKKTRVKKLNELVKKKDWILEGGYTSSWAAPSFERAEKIIVLEVPLYKRLWRIYTRKQLKKQTIKGCWELTKLSFNWKKRYARIKQYEEKIVVFTSADKALEQLTKKRK